MNEGRQAGQRAIDSREVIARYDERYRGKFRIFSYIDACLALFLGRAPAAQPASLAPPRKLLISNYGHLGDMIMLLSLLPAVKCAFPDIEIGILCGSWNKPLVERDPRLTRVHYLDHWNQVRSSASRLEKVATYSRDVVRVRRELRRVGYDTAIDTRPGFPNSIALLRRAGIPTRVGYDQVGFAPLLTHVLEFDYDEKRHERANFARALACLPMDRSTLDEVPDGWLPVDGNGFDILAQHAAGKAMSGYVVLHPGARISAKHWTEEGWVEIACRTIESGQIPVLTGLGAEQDAITARIASKAPGTVNLCRKISWSELVAVIADADMVYSVDTSVGHLAGALDVPCVAIYGGMQNPIQWKPIGRRVALVTQDLPCSPCFQSYGCAHIACLKDTSADQVWLAGTQLTQQ